MKPIPPQLTEFNVAHLGLIPIQKSIPGSARSSWEAIVGDEINGAGIRAVSTTAEGVPYGVANDVFAGIVTGSVAAREGGEAVITVTLAELSRLSHLGQRMTDYEKLRRSLEQLVGTKYKIWNKWRMPMYKQTDTRTFSLVEEIQTVTRDHSFAPDQKEIDYTIRLNPRIVASIDGSLTLMTDTALMMQLKSPMARGLYRLLEAYRRDPSDFTQTRHQIVMTARELVEACRLLGGRHEAASLLRPLFSEGGPIAQLKEAGYLSSVDTSGRGWDAQIIFIFSHSNTVINTTALRLLREAGVTGKNSSSLASLHTTEDIECAIWTVEGKIKKGGIKNPPGLIISTLKETNFADYLELYRKRKRPSVSDDVVKPIVPLPIEPEAERSATELADLAGQILTSLLLIGRINPQQSERLHAAFEADKVSYHQISSLLKTPKQEIAGVIEKWLCQS